MKLSLEKVQASTGFEPMYPDLCDTDAVLYKLSNQANWELVALWFRNIPVDGEEYKPEYIKYHIFDLRRKSETH